jgi:hypothetical protein
MGADLKRLKRDTDSARIAADVPTSSDSSPRSLGRGRWLFALAAVLLVSAGAIWYLTRESAPSQPQKQRQLTFNSSENVVVDGTISPDGRYLSYSDFKGIYLKLMATGETRTIPLPAALKAAPGVRWTMGPWFPDGSRFLANASVGKTYGIWLFSVLGEPRTRFGTMQWLKLFLRMVKGSLSPGSILFPLRATAPLPARKSG